MWTRAGLKSRAKEVFHANYWKTVLAALIISLIAGGSSLFGDINNTSTLFAGSGDSYGSLEYSGLGGFSPMIAALAIGFVILIVLVFVAIAIVVNVFLLNPLLVGIRRFFFTNLHQKAEIREMAFAFDHSYKNTVKIMFFRDLYTFLWTLLFIIPGIVKSYEYRMIPYLLAEYPDMPMEEAFAISRNMMNGNKWKAFVLDLSFFFWFVLSSITAGIVGLFYVQPYYEQTAAALYDAIKLERPMLGGAGPQQGAPFTGSSWGADQGNQGFDQFGGTRAESQNTYTGGVGFESSGQANAGNGEQQADGAVDAPFTPAGEEQPQNPNPSDTEKTAENNDQNV